MIHLSSKERECRGGRSPHERVRGHSGRGDRPVRRDEIREDRGEAEENTGAKGHRSDDGHNPVYVPVCSEGEPEKTDRDENRAPHADDQANFRWWVAVVFYFLPAQETEGQPVLVGGYGNASTRRTG